MSAPSSQASRWYEEAFRSDYRRVYAHRDLESARKEVQFLIQIGVRGRVLDLCCGFGRHSLAMVEQGLDVVGVDLSEELLREGLELPGYERLRGRLLRADACCVPFRARTFDSIVVLFSSFGYFGELGDARMLSEIARALRPDGAVVLDLMNPAFVRARLEAQSHREGADYLLRESRSLSDGGRRVTKEVELRLEGGIVRRWREDVRLYEEAEMRSLLAGRGLALAATFGDFDGRPLTPTSPRMILLARR